MMEYIGTAISVFAILLGIPKMTQAQTVWEGSLLPSIRAAATMIPGQQPRAIHVFREAEKTVHQSAVLEGGSDALVSAPFSVFEVRFPDGWIMVDSGMDPETAANPNAGYARVTIPKDRYELVQKALSDARLIVLTHEDDDHATGVIHTPNLQVIAGKTLLTRPQLQTLMDHPRNPAIQLDGTSGRRYRVFDYESVYPLAAGVVLIKAPGHTPGSQMIYVRLASGKEVLLVGDVVWAMAGVDQLRQKPEAASKHLGEVRLAIQHEMEWLHKLPAEVSIINSHDGDAISRLVKVGVLSEGLDLTLPAGPKQ
jgi:glyoxylase-like metal-dependent hydrolase (beta-lactamase superfamily II)